MFLVRVRHVFLFDYPLVLSLLKIRSVGGILKLEENPVQTGVAPYIVV